MSKQQQYRFSRQTHHFGRDDSISIWERIHIDPWLMLLLLTISFIGLAILYSASTQDVDMVIRQAVSYLLGFTVMITMAQIPPGLYKTFTPIFLCHRLIFIGFGRDYWRSAYGRSTLD